MLTIDDVIERFDGSLAYSTNSKEICQYIADLLKELKERRKAPEIIRCGAVSADTVTPKIRNAIADMTLSGSCQGMMIGFVQMRKGEPIDRIKVERAIAGLTEWRKHVQAESDIDMNISTAIEALNAQLFSEDTTKDTTSDLISRQAAIDGKISIQLANGVEIYSDEAVPVEYLKNLPTIQPEPQEGHWIRTDCGLDVECKCSVCGYKDFVSPHDIYWFKRNYCPNCGAKMRGGA